MIRIGELIEASSKMSWYYKHVVIMLGQKNYGTFLYFMRSQNLSIQFQLLYVYILNN